MAIKNPPDASHLAGLEPDHDTHHRILREWRVWCVVGLAAKHTITGYVKPTFMGHAGLVPCVASQARHCRVLRSYSNLKGYEFQLKGYWMLP